MQSTFFISYLATKISVNTLFLCVTMMSFYVLSHNITLLIRSLFLFVFEGPLQVLKSCISVSLGLVGLSWY